MNKESQYIEYNLTRQNKYHKMVSGFANAQGDTIYIDIDYKGNIKDVDNIHRFLKETLSQKFNRK